VDECFERLVEWLNEVTDYGGRLMRLEDVKVKALEICNGDEGLAGDVLNKLFEVADIRDGFVVYDPVNIMAVKLEEG